MNPTAIIPAAPTTPSAQPSSQPQYTVAQMANAVRQKYPGAYNAVPDDKLVQSWVTKYPAYANQVQGLNPPAKPGEIETAAKGGLDQIKEAGSEIFSGHETPLQGAESGLKAESGAASIATSLLAPVLNRTVKPVVDAIADKVSNVPAVQKFAMSDAAKPVERVATDLSNAGNVAGTITGIEGGVEGAKTIAEHAPAAINAVKTAAAKIPESPEDIVAKQTTQANEAKASAHDAIDTEVRELANKYPTVGKTLNAAEVGSKTKPIEVLSSYAKGEALPAIAKGKIQVDNATAFLKNKIEELSDLKDKLVKSGSDSTPIDAVKTRISQVIDSQSWSAAKKAAMKEEAGKLSDAWEASYPDGIPNEELDALKTEHTGESTSYNSKSPFSLDAHAVVGKALRQLVQDNAKEAPIDELNKVIASHYDAIKLLNSMRGKAPHGGALSKMLNNTIGEVGGLAGGLAVGHPFIGAMVGRAGAEAVSEILNSHFISNPLKRSMINNMKGTDPAVVQKALDYLDQEGAKSAPEEPAE